MEKYKDLMDVSNELIFDRIDSTVGYMRKDGSGKNSKTHIEAIRILCLKLEYNFKRLAELSAQLKQSEQ